MTMVAYGQLTHGSSLWLIPSSNLESWVPVTFPGTPQKRPLVCRTQGPSAFLTVSQKVWFSGSSFMPAFRLQDFLSH